VGPCTGGQTLHFLPFLAGFPTIAIYVGEHDANAWRAHAGAHVVERVTFAYVCAFAGVSRCESTEHAARSVAIGEAGCLNPPTGPRGDFACLSPSGAHADLSPGLWRSLWPYWRSCSVCSTRGAV